MPQPVSRPSCMVRTRSQASATRGSCVAMMRLPPSRVLREMSSDVTSRAVAESSDAVGSSARIQRGRLTKARATATR